MSSTSSPDAPRVESGSLSGRVKEGSLVLICNADTVPGNGIGYVKNINDESGMATVLAAGTDHTLHRTKLCPFTATRVPTAINPIAPISDVNATAVLAVFSLVATTVANVRAGNGVDSFLSDFDAMCDALKPIVTEPELGEMRERVRHVYAEAPSRKQRRALTEAVCRRLLPHRGRRLMRCEIVRLQNRGNSTGRPPSPGSA